MQKSKNPMQEQKLAAKSIRNCAKIIRREGGKTCKEFNYECAACKLNLLAGMLEWYAEVIEVS